MKIIYVTSFVLVLFVGIAPGLRCFRCAGCSEGGESVSRLSDAEECPEPNAMCLISQFSSGLMEGGCCRGQGRRSCTNGMAGEAGKCYVTRNCPADAWFPEERAWDNGTFTTCYCNDNDGCNGSSSLMTFRLSSSPLTLLLTPLTLIILYLYRLVL